MKINKEKERNVTKEHSKFMKTRDKILTTLPLFLVLRFVSQWNDQRSLEIHHIESLK